jgi:hypothetical protein
VKQQNKLEQTFGIFERLLSLTQPNLQYIKKVTSKKMKNLIHSVLSILFPFRELNDRPSVFVQQTWLDKAMNPTQVKDYLWTPSYDAK